MFNVTILKMKDIKKYLIGMTITAILVVIASNYLPKISDEPKLIQKSLFNNNMIGCLKQTVPVVATINKENSTDTENKNIEEKNILQNILKTQISSIREIEKLEEISENNTVVDEKIDEKEDINNKQENVPEELNNKKDELQLAQTGVETQVITNNPIKESYNAQYNKVKIKNETEYQLTEEMLKPDVTIENKNILIFHTHTCESYTSSQAYPYTPTGNYRTTNLNYTVARVGTELENQLKQYKLNVIHDTTYHDYPSYNGSYANSLNTVENIIKTTPSDIIIDLHRDAIGSRSDYAPIVKIGENDVAAQIMFVIRN